MQDIRIEGITQTNVRSWAVVGARPTGHDGGYILVVVDEFRGVGAKARAIQRAGTNRVVTTAGATLVAMGSAA